MLFVNLLTYLWVNIKNIFTKLARKMMNEVRYPEIKGKVCRALPYEKEGAHRVDTNAGLFIKGFGKG